MGEEEANIHVFSATTLRRTPAGGGELGNIWARAISQGLATVTPPDISVCIVNWRTREALRRCLDSLAAHAAGLQLQVIVVDNGSGDGSAEMVTNNYPQVELIANEENVGYAAANNQALRGSRAPYRLLLNPDIIIKPGALSALLKFAHQHPHAGAIAPRLIYPDGRLQYNCLTSSSRDLRIYNWRIHGLYWTLSLRI